MPGKHSFQNSLFRAISCAATAAVTMVIVFVLAFTIQAAQAQTFKVIHTFSGLDGANPTAGVTMDAAGNLYGTTFGVGPIAGTVFELRHVGSSWLLAPSFDFQTFSDGADPDGVIIGTNGSIYGTTRSGGGAPCQCGIVFKLRPSPMRRPRMKTVLHRFTGNLDGSSPSGGLVADPAGNLYGTTIDDGGGAGGVGAVYEMTQSNGSWTESIIYGFAVNNGDAEHPYGGVIFDSAGNLYGTSAYGGAYGNGTVFKLTPSANGWTDTVLYSFQNSSDGGHPYGNLVFDRSGNLYGESYSGGLDNAGTIFELTPSGGSWTFQLLHSFGTDGPTLGGLIIDAAGNLYGTTYEPGSVFRLTPSGGGWTYSSLHHFTGGRDGAEPLGNLLLDSHGNLFGTTWAGGGAGSYGVVYEIMP